MSQFNWPIAKKKKASRNKRFYGKMECLSLLVKRGGLWAKHIGVK
jgi:hypothetical protein